MKIHLNVMQTHKTFGDLLKHELNPFEQKRCERFDEQI